MPLTAAEIWRDFEVAGNPASGAHKPIKSDIRAWGASLEAIGGFNAPGTDTTAALFSAGAGVAPVWRKIVGFDLPNPSTQVPGAVFAKPAPVGGGQILAGLGIDGEFDLAAVTGSGSIVLSDNPSFTGTVKINGLNFLSSSGGTHNVIAPDGRLGFQMQGSPSVNFYKADTHSWFNPVGSVQFAQLNQIGLTISPPPLTNTTPNINNALAINATWNNGTTVDNLIYAQITDTASNFGSRLMRFDVSGQLRFAVDKSGTINSGGIIIRGSSSGTHTIMAGAAAAGTSNCPPVTGELVSTGNGLPVTIQGAAIDFNVVGDTQIPVKLPSGFIRYRIGAIVFVNTGPGASSLTAAQFGVFTAASGGGIAIVAAGASLAAITSNSVGVNGATSQATLAVGNTAFFDTGFNPTLFIRITTAQGAAAAGRVYVQLVPVP